MPTPPTSHPPTQSPPFLPIGLIKNKTFLMVTLSSLVMIVAALLLTHFTPKHPPSVAELPKLQSPLPAPSIVSIPTRTTIVPQFNFTGEQPIVPNEVAIFRSTQSTGFKETIIASLVTDFNLSVASDNNPSKPSKWVNADRSMTLLDLVDYGFIVLETPLGSGPTTSFTAEQLIQKTDAFLKQYVQSNPYTNFVIEYWHAVEGDLELSIDDNPLAQYAYVSIKPSYNSIPIRFKNHSDTENFVLFNSEYKVVQFIITPELYALEAIAKTTPISLDSALEQVKQGNYVVVDAYKPLEATKTDLETAEQTQLSRVELEYRLDPSTDFYTPYYHFYGQTTSYSSPLYEIELITPAVELSP